MSLSVVTSVVRKNNNEIGTYCNDIIPYHTQADEDAAAFSNAFTYDESGREYIVGLFDYISSALKDMETDISNKVENTRNYVKEMIIAAGGNPDEGLQ